MGKMLVFVQRVLLVSLTCLLSSAVGVRLKREFKTYTIDNLLAGVPIRAQVDLVILIQRSLGVTAQYFNAHPRELVEKYLQQHVTVHRDYTRLAVITFAADVEIPIDSINRRNELFRDQLTKCDIFHGDSSLWNKVQFYYDVDRVQPAMLNSALDYVTWTFQNGSIDRPNANRVFMLLINGDYSPNDYNSIVDKTEKLKSELNTSVYAVGIEQWLASPGNIQILAKSNYAKESIWQEFFTVNKTSYGAGGPAAILIPSEYDQCSQTCGHGAMCMCNADTGFIGCQCVAGFTYVNGSCLPCPIGTYKSDLGKYECMQCVPGSSADGEGAISSFNCSCLAQQCEDPCTNFNCTANAICTYNNTDNAVCTCAPGWTTSSLNECTIDEVNCLPNLCLNGGSCVDLTSDYLCLCPYYYNGRNCEEPETPCIGKPCANNGTCIWRFSSSEPFSYVCNCTEAYRGDACLTPNSMVSTTTTPNSMASTTTTPNSMASTTTTPNSMASTTISAISTSSFFSTLSVTITNATNTPTEISDKGLHSSTASFADNTNEKPSKDNTTLYIIIGASVGGAVLFIILVLIVVVVVALKRKKPVHDNVDASRNGGPVMRHSSSQRMYKQRNRTISNRFSGFWKKRTMSPGKWKMATTRGLPSVPKRRMEIETLHENGTLDKEIEIEYAVYENQQIEDTDGMSGWRSYISDLQGSGLLLEACILKISGRKQALSSGWNYADSEIKKLLTLMDNADVHVPLTIQGSEYHIISNDGKLCLGKTIGDNQVRSVVIIGKTTDFLIGATADGSKDIGECLHEIQWITDHINSEGY